MSRLETDHRPRTGPMDPWPGSTHPFVKGMESRRARQLLYGASVTNYDAGDIIFHEGDPADRFFLVVTGSIALETRVDGHSVQIDTVHAGEVFGWSWLFAPFAYHFQARVLEPAEVIVCDGSRLLVRCEEDPAFGYDLMKRISQLVIHRLQSTRKRLVGIETVLNPPEESAKIH